MYSNHLFDRRYARTRHPSNIICYYITGVGVTELVETIHYLPDVHNGLLYELALQPVFYTFTIG